MEKIYPVSTKNRMSFGFVFFALFFITKTSFSQTYCAASATSTFDDEIFNVTFGSLNNSSTCSTTGGPGSALNMYSNYTSVLPAQTYSLGSNYPLSVTVGQCNGNPYSGIVGVWIDFNNNGVFTDSGEEVLMTTNTLFAVAGTVFSAPGGVSIPFSSSPGTTRMRVIATESTIDPDPCTSPSWGEVEDYNITIVSPFPLDLGISAIINPLSSKVCYAVDTIVTRVKNNGNMPIDFSVNPTVITVNTTGPSANTYTIAVNTGTLASYTAKDYTITTNYNLANIGTYKLTAYTTLTGDGTPLDDTTHLTITRSPLFSTTSSPSNSVCLGVPIQLNSTMDPFKQVGNGTIVNSSTTYPTPYGYYNGGAKHQFLYLASELTAAGLVAGNIDAINFDVTSLNSVAPLLNYNIAIATTTLSSITAMQTAGFATYFSSASYMPVSGTNTHTFSTPFNWDGVSNIIIQNCFNNNNAGVFGGNASVSQSTTPFNSSVAYIASNNATLCASTIVSGSMAQRPNTWFSQVPNVNYTWSPVTELSAANISNPIANVTSTRTYTITGILAGCMSYDTVRIVSLPTPFPNLGSDTLLCTQPAVLHSNTNANNYLWNDNSTNSNLNITTSGKYWVRATDAGGCTNSDTILVSVGNTPIVALGPDTAFCQGSTINLYVTNGIGNSYLWSTGATSTSITVGTVGTYSIVATHTSGCQASDIINVTSKAKPTVGLTFVGQTAYCVDDNFNRLLTEGTPSGGTYIGASVTSNTFNTTQAGQGQHIIIYSYTGPNGCSNVAKDTLTVNACVGIEELTETVGLNVYPNPTTGVFTLELNTTADVTGTLNITSIDGKVVFNDKVEGNGLISKSINISDIANGIYYLKVETKDAIRTYKVLKQ